MILLAVRFPVPDDSRIYPEVLWGTLFVLAALVGSILEIISTWIEVHWDKKLETKYAQDKNWFDYLARICPNEPVGYGYMSRKSTTLYFEMTMALAGVVAGVGAVALFQPSLCWIAVMLIVTGLVTWLLLKSASVTHEVLCRTRKEINERLEGSCPVRGAANNA